MLINFSLLYSNNFSHHTQAYYLLSGKYYTQFESVVSVTLLAWVLGWFFCIVLWVCFFLSHQWLPLHRVRNSAPFSLLQLQQVRNLISPLNMFSSCPAFYMLRTLIWTRQEVIKASSADPGSWFSFGAMLPSLSIHSAPFSTEAAHSLKKTQNLRIKAGNSSYWYINSYCFIMYKCISQFTGNNYITLDILNHA